MVPWFPSSSKTGVICDVCVLYMYIVHVYVEEVNSCGINMQPYKELLKLTLVHCRL